MSMKGILSLLYLSLFCKLQLTVECYMLYALFNLICRPSSLSFIEYKRTRNAAMQQFWIN
jgi:hypothetical protein